MQRHETLECPFEDLLTIVCRKWPLLVIATVGRKGERRFGQLMEDLHGISPRSLSQVLEDLCGLGLLDRRSYRGIPPRVGYSLTTAGHDLVRSVNPLLGWASRLRPEVDCPLLRAISEPDAKFR